MSWRAASRFQVAALIAASGLLSMGSVQTIAQSSRSSGSSAAIILAQKDAPVPSEPHALSAAFGDWTMRCQSKGAAAKETEQVCDITQSVQIDGLGPVAQISLRAAPKSKEKLILVHLPANIHLQGKVMVAMNKQDQRAIALGWQYCLPNGCAAEGPLTVSQLNLWRAKKDRGIIAYADAMKRDVVVPFSFRGLAQALNALESQ